MSQRDDDPYAAAWRRYRRWSRAFWAVFVRYLPVLDVASRALGWRRGRVSLVSGVLGLVLIGWGVPAESQVHISAEERFFRIEWQLERAGGRDVAIVGSVANHYLYRLEWV